MPFYVHDETRKDFGPATNITRWKKADYLISPAFGVTLSSQIRLLTARFNTILIVPSSLLSFTSLRRTGLLPLAANSINISLSFALMAISCPPGPVLVESRGPNLPRATHSPWPFGSTELIMVSDHSLSASRPVLPTCQLGLWLGQPAPTSTHRPTTQVQEQKASELC